MDEIQIVFESKKFDEREKQGKDYSKIMNARLVLLGNNLLASGIPLPLVKTIKGYVYGITKNTRLEITEGLWYSAERAADLMAPNTDLQELIEQYSLPIDQTALINEIKVRIQKAITDLY